MRKALLLLLLLPWPLAAQTALSIAPQQCVWKQGDDVRWAARDLDESDWQPASTWLSLATPTPYFWLRCRFDPGQLVLPRQSDSGCRVFATLKEVAPGISDQCFEVGTEAAQRRIVVELREPPY